MNLPNQASPILRYASTATISYGTSIGVRPSVVDCYTTNNCTGAFTQPATKDACCVAGGNSYRLANETFCRSCPIPIPQNNPPVQQVQDFVVGRPPGVWPPKFLKGSD